MEGRELKRVSQGRLIAVSVLVLFISCIEAGRWTCQDDWSVYTPQGQCFKVVDDKMLTWAESRKACRQNEEEEEEEEKGDEEGKNGGDLVTINSTEVNKFLMRILPANKSYWIGLNDLQTENRFRWLDFNSSAMTSSFSRWKWGEPNNIGDEDCVRIESNSLLQWNDVSCQMPNHFICQKPTASQRRRVSTTPKSAHRTTPTTTTATTPTTTTTTSSTPNAPPNTPTKTTTPPKISTANNHITTKTTTPPKASTTTRKTTTKTITPPKTSTTASKTTATTTTPPKASTTNTNTTTKTTTPPKASTTTSKTTATTTTNTTMAAMNPCPPGDFYYPGDESCLRLHHSGQNWPWAMRFCRKSGGNLAILPDAAINQFFVGVIQRAAGGTGSYWIGLHDQDTEGRFRWLTSLTTTKFTFWSPTEPNNRFSREHCVDAAASRNYRWNDFPCHKLHDFACQMPNRFSGPLTCPDSSWSLYNAEGRCFKVVDYEKLNWTSSRQACQREGGELASITSSGLNEFLKTNLSTARNYWIGLNDRQVEGEYRWLDAGYGSAFASWSYQEIDEYEGQDCVRIESDTNFCWTKVECDQGSNFICEQPAKVLVHAIGN